MKTQILTAVIPLIKTYGLHFKMLDLARDLGISKSTLYQFYPSKQLLIEDAFNILVRELREEEAKIYHSSASVEEKLKATMKFHSKKFEPFQSPLYANLYATPSIADKMRKFNEERIIHINHLLDEGVQEGLIRPVQRDVFINMLHLAQKGFLDVQTLEELNMTYSDVIANVFDIMLYGVIKQK